MNRLPDGSGFFTGLVGERESGFMNWLKYRKHGQARLYVFLWRMQRDYYTFSRQLGLGPPLNRIQAIYRAVRILI